MFRRIAPVHEPPAAGGGRTGWNDAYDFRWKVFDYRTRDSGNEGSWEVPPEKQFQGTGPSPVDG